MCNIFFIENSEKWPTIYSTSSGILAFGCTDWCFNCISTSNWHEWCNEIKISTCLCVIITLFLTWFAMWADENDFFSNLNQEISTHCYNTYYSAVENKHNTITNQNKTEQNKNQHTHNICMMFLVHYSMNIWLIMTEANDYDFEKVDDSLKCLRGILVDSLRTVNIHGFILLNSFQSVRKKSNQLMEFSSYKQMQVLHQVHPNLSAEDDALSRVECLCIRLLGMLCAKPPPHTIQVWMFFLAFFSQNFNILCISHNFLSFENRILKIVSLGHCQHRSTNGHSLKLATQLINPKRRN